MKTKILFLSLAFIVTLASCSKEADLTPKPIQNNIKNQISLSDVRIRMPENMSKDIVSLNLTDLQRLFYSTNNQNTNKLNAPNNIGYSLDELNSTIATISKQYPSTDSLTTNEIEKINENFPYLSTNEIIENIDVIDSFYKSLIRYETVKKMSNRDKPDYVKSNIKSDYFGYDLNTEEFWYLVWNPSLADPVKKATNKAFELTESNFKGQSAYRNKADAFRHATWNALMAKYIGENSGSVSDCINKARTFSNKHESGASQPASLTLEDWTLDKTMDLHNNNIGLNYFASKAWIVKEGWLKVKRVRAPSETEIASSIKEYSNNAMKITNVNEAGRYTNFLIFIKD
jgi:hypothetical protein